MTTTRKQNQDRHYILAAGALLLIAAFHAPQAANPSRLAAGSAPLATALPLLMAAGLAYARTNKAQNI